jgi:hypothetical protein
MKKIVFLPFLNDYSGKKWRERLERAFLNNDGGLTETINEIRKKSHTKEDLHTHKIERQEKWLNYLIEQTASLFKVQLEDLPDDDKDPDETTIVAALPEFFWCDINDNNKYKDDIVGYHKPLYIENAVKYFTESNAFTELTKTYPNLIIFAGTAMWKVINKNDNKDEEIFNSLIVYCGGAYKESITKHHVSVIDGFYGKQEGTYTLLKEKNGESTMDISPFIEFNGNKFAFDICLDFEKGKVPDKNNQGKYIKTSLSTQLCKETPDVNVLIAAGMPVDENNIGNIKSNILLRCDGLYPPYGEILIKNDFGRKIDNSRNSQLIGTFYYDPNENDEA